MRLFLSLVAPPWRGAAATARMYFYKFGQYLHIYNSKPQRETQAGLGCGEVNIEIKLEMSGRLWRSLFIKRLLDQADMTGSVVTLLDS